ncbi:hypothetical protein J2X66_003207 [Pseudomonas sp. 3296]|uniref:hypothetical protein n=1 Tax=Pseudomonas sp. 3296 TaxID=2817753 RepID=UPI00285C5453|nr:hypothetical protein [Pseudomonas sp. 3296]MDR6916338.1 hypothetical protein [Pseudomonas sp. 3296]
MPVKRKINFAYLSPGWGFIGGDKSVLKNNRKVTAEEYEPEMAGNLFCPGCCTNIERTPKGKDLFANNREAFFRHLSKWKHIACYLRAKKPLGKRYNSWEEAKRAIDHEELSIISQFLQAKPEVIVPPSTEYDETVVEDENGPDTPVPIGRHHGESFQLPSKISTVAGICRNFEVNLQKYFYLPEAKHAINLAELLVNVADVDYNIMDVDQVPKLYFGRIARSWNAGSYSGSTRMTRLKCGEAVKDFTLKLTDGFSRDKNINDNAKDRIVMFYGKITTNGIGLAAEGLAWGEVSLLPAKYNDLLLPG